MDEASELPKELGNQPIDYITSAVKGTLGVVPFAGSLLAELAGTIIPNQRLDRIARFVEVLETKLSALDQGFVQSQLTNESFSDLLEEAARQAARSLSNERRQYIASLIANSLSQRDIEYVESKHLLGILGELNDIEIVWLRYYLEPWIQGDEEFRTKHTNVITPIVAAMGDTQSVIDKQALQRSYWEHLAQLGLLNPKYQIDRSTHMPEFRRDTGAPEIHGYETTSLGRLLLRQIGLSEEEQA